MGDDRRRGEGFWGFLTYLFEQSRHWLIVLIGVIFFGVWGFVHWSAEPGQRVVVWGMFQYTKRAVQMSSGTHVQQMTPIPPLIEQPRATPRPTMTPRPHATASPVPHPTSIPRPLQTATPTPIPQPRYDFVVYVVTEQNMIDSRLNGAILSFFQQQGKRTAQLSSQAVHSRSTFEKIFGGDASEVTQRGFLQYGHYAILGKSSISFVQNPSLENLITATVSLDLRVISSHTGMIEQQIQLTQKGPGFSENTAQKKAETLLIEELNRQLAQILLIL